MNIACSHGLFDISAISAVVGPQVLHRRRRRWPAVDVLVWPVFVPAFKYVCFFVVRVGSCPPSLVVVRPC